MSHDERGVYGTAANESAQDDMASAFSDHYSAVADSYARFRPSYPPELFAWLATHSPGRGLAWDCDTGNGQAALGLVEHFQVVNPTPSILWGPAGPADSNADSAGSNVARC